MHFWRKSALAQPHSPQCDIEGFPKRFSVLGKTWDLVCVPSPLSTGKAILFIFISQLNCAIFFFLVILLTDELSQYILFHPSPLWRVMEFHTDNTPAPVKSIFEEKRERKRLWTVLAGVPSIFLTESWWSLHISRVSMYFTSVKSYLATFWVGSKNYTRHVGLLNMSAHFIIFCKLSTSTSPHICILV